MALERITDIVAFVRVADARSFTVAAQRLGLSRSAVGKYVTRLEEQLGVRLLHRTTRSVTLTDEGLGFHERCVPILADLEQAELAMTSRSGQPTGRLRLDLPVSFGRLHVLPLVQRFMETWPEVSVNVTFTDRYVDLVDEGIDLVVRIGGGDDSRLVARTLAAHRLVTCATPGYWATHGVPRTPADLANHHCLAFTHAGRSREWRFQRVPGGETDDPRTDTVVVPVHGRLCAGNAEALHDAALSGGGVAQLPTFLVGDDLRSGRLVGALGEYGAVGEPIRIAYATARHLSPKVRRFIDLLIESWRPLPPWDQGDRQG